MPLNQIGDHPDAKIDTYNNVDRDQNIYFAPRIDIVARLDLVFKAAYDCGPRADSRCFKGTRVEVVREIDDWADSPGNRHLCLLDVPAGFGKPAVARTVAQRWNVSKCLLSTFFFFRNSGDQSKGVWLVPTLSYQLTLTSKFMIDTGAGVIDADYRGVVSVLLFNLSDNDFEVKEGDRIAQLIIEKIHTPDVLEVQDLDETLRGAGGFGSTGGHGSL